jgi:hypothetical protein
MARVGTSKTTDEIKTTGSLVAWTLMLGKPGKKQTSFFVNTIKLGTKPQARLTVLKPDGKKKLHYVVAAQSDLMDLTPYIGFTVQFPLNRAIPVTATSRGAIRVPRTRASRRHCRRPTRRWPAAPRGCSRASSPRSA